MILCTINVLWLLYHLYGGLGCSNNLSLATEITSQGINNPTIFTVMHDIGY